MKIAVVGGGSAGFISAAYLTRALPSCELFHVYDHTLPSIGVGEGTTPPVYRWLRDTTGLDFHALQSCCELTRKDGIRFEGWGGAHPWYTHYFSPRFEGGACHLSASRLPAVLAPHIRGTSLDRNVVEVIRRKAGTRLLFSTGEHLDVEYVVDARGFPRSMDDDALEFSFVPTNAALLQRGPPLGGLTATRAVARPHGWVFVIPLSDGTSYGYVHNENIGSGAEVEADFTDFLRDESVQLKDPRFLRFPNFVTRRFFDGSVFRVGNAASFIEPLEATALSVILHELRLIVTWISAELAGFTTQPGGEERATQALNDHLTDWVSEIALFVSWHYSRGSLYDTAFWRHARELGEERLVVPGESRDGPTRRFHEFRDAAASLSPRLALAESPDDLLEFEGDGPLDRDAFGGFLDLGFAKVGHGIGAFI